MDRKITTRYPHKTMKMTPKIEAFVSHFGEMGSRWGMTRTVGQIYALLMIIENPMNADDLVDALSISRSNVSMGLKELQSWRLIKPVHFPGDRKEYYETPDDIWEVARIIFEERRKRELEPTMTMLRAEMMNDPVSEQGHYAHTKMLEIHDMIDNLTNWADELQKLNNKSLVQLMKLGSSVTKLVSMKDQLTGKKSDK